MLRVIWVCLERVYGFFLLAVGRASDKMPLNEPNQWMCIQHQHFYLLTCRLISSHTCYSEIMARWHSFAFSFTLPESCFSILGFHNKRLIRPARPICFIFFSLYHFVPHAPLVLSPHLSPCFGPLFFHSPTPLSSPSISSLMGPRCPAALEDRCTSTQPASLPCRELGLGPIRQGF